MKNERCSVPLSSLFSVDTLIALYYAEQSNTPDLKQHKLDCWQFYCSTQNKIDIKIEDDLYTISKGEILFVPPFVRRHVRNAHGRNDCILCSFICDSPAMELFRNTHTALTDVEKDMVTRIVFLGLQCTKRLQGPTLHGFTAKEDVPADMLSFFKVYLELFLALLYNRLRGNLDKVNYVDGKMETRYSLLVSQMKDYLAAHLNENITIEALAKEFFLSPTHAKRIFKQITGRTIISYYTELKINDAKMLIRSSDLSLREISEQLAYSSPAHFSDVFRRHVGQTPSEYRQAHVLANSQRIRTLG